MFKNILYSLSFLAFCFTTVNAQKTNSLSVNSKDFTEYSPTLDARGTVMVFQSDQNTYRTWQLMESRLQKNGKWSNPRPIDSINNHGQVPKVENKFQGAYIAGPSLSYGGDSLYFCANFEEGKGGRDIYLSIRQPDGVFGPPADVGKNINTEADEDFPSVSANGRSLYFTRPNGKSNEYGFCSSIYQSKADDYGLWQPAVLLPPTINQGCEKAPRIQADNVSLVFSSMRKGGKGDYDLYKSEYDIFGEWTKPIPVDELNSAFFDQFVFVPLQEDFAYYNSLTLQDKTPDIYTLNPVPNILKLQKFATVGLQVQDSLEKDLLNAKVEISILENSKKVLLSTENLVGTLGLELRRDYKYIIVLKKEGYLPFEKILDLTPKEDTVRKYTFNILLQKQNPTLLSRTDDLKIGNTSMAKNTKDKTVRKNLGKATVQNTLEIIGTDGKVLRWDSLQAGNSGKILEKELLDNKVKVVFTHLNFKYASADLEPEAYPDLELIVDFFKKHPNIKLEIAAHTDDTGTEESNDVLGLQRANSVGEYLKANQISQDRFILKSYGETQPLVENTSDENRARNRRVEFRVVQNNK